MKRVTDYNSDNVHLGMKFGGFCLVTKFGLLKFSGLWFTIPPKRHTSPTNLSQALCVPDRDLLNYFPYEENQRAQCELLCSSTGCWFSHCAPMHSGLSDSVISLGSLEHGCQFDSGSQLGKWPPSPRQTSHTRLPLLGDSRLLVSSPASCSPWRAQLGVQPGNRGWEAGVGQKGGSGGQGKKKGAHLKGYFLSRFPLFSFSPHYQDVWCQTSSLIQLRWEMRYKVQTKNWKWHIILRRGENASSCSEVCFWLNGSSTRNS